MSTLGLGRLVFSDANGKPLAGGKVFVYSAGTTVLATVYSDLLETVPSPTNSDGSLPLDGSGSVQIFGTGNFSFSVFDYLGNPIPGASGLVEGLVSPAMQAVTEAGTVSSALGLLGGLASGTVVGWTEKSVGVSLTAQSGFAYVATSAITLTLPLTTGLTTKFYFSVFATNGIVVLQPQGTDKIDGGTAGASLTLQTTQSCTVVTDANGNWWLVSLTPVAVINPPLVFSAGQSGTLTLGGGAARVDVEGWAGGGPGGPAASSGAGGGGGGGGYISDTYGVSAGQLISYSVPNGGAAYALGGTVTSGGTLIFGSASATGGIGGGQGSGGVGSGGLPGSGAAARFTEQGQPGGAGVVAGGIAFGGVGGGTVQFGGTVQAVAATSSGANGAATWGLGQGAGGAAASGTATSGAPGLLIVKVSQF